MAYETIILEHHETVLLIRLNRPEALNAINGKMLKADSSPTLKEPNSEWLGANPKSDPFGSGYGGDDWSKTEFAALALTV